MVNKCTVVAEAAAKAAQTLDLGGKHDLPLMIRCQNNDGMNTADLFNRIVEMSLHVSPEKEPWWESFYGTVMAFPILSGTPLKINRTGLIDDKYVVIFTRDSLEGATAWTKGAHPELVLSDVPITFQMANLYEERRRRMA